MSKVLDDPAAVPAAKKESGGPFTTISGRHIAPLYGPANVEKLEYARDLANPGQYPYTRGVHETMYRGKVWTMRQFAGFGSARQTNERFKYLLEHGGHGLSVAFDLPTLMGRDPDHPLSLGEVGKCGVAISSLKDMETLFHFGMWSVQYAIMSTRIRMLGRGGKMYSFWAMNSFRMSACTVPASLDSGTPCFSPTRT